MRKRKKNEKKGEKKKKGKKMDEQLTHLKKWPDNRPKTTVADY